MKKLSLIALAVISMLSAEDLKTTVGEVLSTNPIILERLNNYNATTEDMNIAKAGFYPKLDLSLGVGYENTKLKSRPAGVQNNAFDFTVYDNTLAYTQNIFKGFETTYQIKEQENRILAAAYNYVEKVNSTAFEMVNQYLLILKQKKLLQNAQENIDINQEILEKVQKLYDSGLTTLSEVNKMESSLALAKSNYIVQENNLKDSKYNMHKVFGRYLDLDAITRPEANFALPETLEDATQFAMLNNPSLLVSKYNIKLAQASYQKSKSAFYPQVDVEVAQNMTSNLGGSEGERDRFRAMAYLKYNFFNGFADEATLQKNVSQVHRETQIKNTLRRNTIDDLSLSWTAHEQLSKQLIPLEAYQSNAKKTLELYKKEYDLGRRSLLDLLSAQNDFISAESQIINADYSNLFAKYRILDALGTLVTTIMGESNVDYSNVGLNINTTVDYSHRGKNTQDYSIPTLTLDLNTTKPKNLDTLPILLDKDTDLIVDDLDICNNSLNNKMRTLYGCAFIYKDTVRIERYRGFLFTDKSEILTQDAKERLNKLIEQIKSYGLKNMKFDILGSVDDAQMSKKEMLNLSQKRAQAVKEKLIDAGAKSENITLNALGDEAPLYTNGLYENEGVALNNRVDIVVRKLIINFGTESASQPVEDYQSLKNIDKPVKIVVPKKEIELDTDGDGVFDSKDISPKTPVGFKVDAKGYPLTKTLRVYFKLQKYALTDDSMDEIKSFAQFLKENPTYKVIISGHTDNTGDEHKNKILSTNRAYSVMEALASHGIDEERFTAIGKGSSVPVADNETKEGRNKNRRIEVELTH